MSESVAISHNELKAVDSLCTAFNIVNVIVMDLMMDQFMDLMME